MHLSIEWPSLTDELALADALFGRRGEALVASWLNGELSRIDDMDFARSFSDHIDLPGAHAEDYLHRRIGTSSGTLLGGIRFYGRNISRPFVEVIAHSSMFAPPVLRLRARPDRLTGAHVILDESIYAARYCDMHRPASHVWLDPFDRVEDAEAIVSTRYQQLATDDPALARNVFPSTTADLLRWHNSGQLRAVRAGDTVVGLLAVVPGRIEWIAGDEINEEVIKVDHRGHGYASLAQTVWAAHVACDQRQLLIGTIDRLNTASRRTAQTAGRRRVLDAVFVSLRHVSSSTRRRGSRPST